jgi:dTDP-4-amino-4,6-dideoxygalactose transaminase
VHAAIGRTHLGRLDEAIEVRNRIAARYDKALGGNALITPLLVPAECVSNYYKYVAFLDPGIARDALKHDLREQSGVGLAGEVYALPLHRQPVFAGLADRPFTAADDVCARHICLPIHSDMTGDEADHVVNSLMAALDRATTQRGASA